MSTQDNTAIASHSFSAFNALTLELQRLAQEQPLSRFHRHALSGLQELIPFDKAWWGRAALVENLPEEHSSQVFGLPASYVEDWQSIREQDITVQQVHANPGRSVIIDSQHHDTPVGLRWLGRKHGFSELLCIIHIDAKTQLSVHLTLYRKIGAPAFTHQGQFLLDHLMPHLVAAAREAAERHCRGRLVLVHEGGYAEAYVPFCGLATIEELVGVRTAVEDPMLPFIRLQQPGTAHSRFLREEIEALAARLL